jgi:hypothetical protein
LRNKIYVLAVETNIVLVAQDDDSEVDCTAIPSPLSLLCRQTYNEIRNHNTRTVLQLQSYLHAADIEDTFMTHNIDLDSVRAIEFSKPATADLIHWLLGGTRISWERATSRGFSAVQRLVFNVSSDTDTGPLEVGELWKTSFGNSELEMVIQRPS